MAHTELLFPPRLIAVLAELRSQTWQQLVEDISVRPVGDPHRRAFILLMARLAGCLTCQSESWRAHQGCELCAQQTIRKFRGTDDQLIALYQEYKNEIDEAVPNEIKNEYTLNKD
ncbi:MAG: hypothetical protein Kow0088_07530 [Anaerolineales bacterium]